MPTPSSTPSNPTPDPDPFGHLFAVVGEDGFARLTAAFYRRVRGDDLLGPMYPADDWDGAEQRLRDFLVQRFGGPDRYSQQRGHPRLRMRHAPFAVTPAARDRWVLLMGEALAEADLPEPAGSILTQFFDQVATFMINRPAGST
ncbi:MAG: globin [Planctomycetota bacterium]